MRTLAVYNLKGGVGKTATAVNLAFLAAVEGRRTLLWDLDAQGAASFYLRVRPRVKGGKKLMRGDRDLLESIHPTEHDGLHVLPADPSYSRFDLVLDGAKRPERHLSRLLEPLAESYDLVVLDCPPSVSLLSEAIFHAADVLLVPVIPTTLSLRTLEQIEGSVADKAPRRLRLAPFFCMVDGRKSLHREVVADPGPIGSSFLRATIPFASVVERMGVAQAPLPTYAPTSPASSAYLALWREVRSMLE